MIKSIKVDWVHWVKKEVKFDKQTRIVWMSKIGKTTILNCIMACYSWYYPWYWTTLPDGRATLKTEAFDVEMSNKRIVGWWTLTTNQAEIIRYIVPGNFFKLTKSTWDQRSLITKILDIDSSILDDANNNLKRLKAEEKEFDAKKDQISDDAIRLEEAIEELNIEKPIEIKAIPDNSSEILNAYTAMENKFASDNIAIRWRNQITKEDYETQTKNAELYNYSEIKKLEESILDLELKQWSIHREATQLKDAKDYNCWECWTLIKIENTDDMLKQLRAEYKEVTDQIPKAKEHLIKLQSDRNNHIAQVEEPAYESILAMEISSSLQEKSKAVWIKYTPGNTEEYNIYTTALRDYDMQENRKSTLQEELDIKDKQLKDLDSVNITKSIKKYQKIKTDFNKTIEEKVKETWLDIRLFERLKNGNMKETFTIYDKEWNKYWATSTGNELYIELLIAKLFIKYLDLDFILFDKWESVGINLRTEILKEIWDLQLIATEVTKDKTIKVMNI